jgi:hypothetical protein
MYSKVILFCLMFATSEISMAAEVVENIDTDSPGSALVQQNQAGVLNCLGKICKKLNPIGMIYSLYSCESKRTECYDRARGAYEAQCRAFQVRYPGVACPSYMEEEMENEKWLCELDFLDCMYGVI